MRLWNRTRTPSLRNPGLTAFLDEGSEFDGRYTFSGVALLNGTFKGEIVSADTRIIGEKGLVTATIRAGTVVISGEVVGSVLPRSASR
jgi:cytoskeletal protein CcmA (bactofilin family)